MPLRSKRWSPCAAGEVEALMKGYSYTDQRADVRAGFGRAAASTKRRVSFTASVADTRLSAPVHRATDAAINIAPTPNDVNPQRHHRRRRQSARKGTCRDPAAVETESTTATLDAAARCVRLTRPDQYGLFARAACPTTRFSIAARTSGTVSRLLAG